MTTLSHDVAFNAQEAAWERQEQPSDLECWICERTLTVGEEEAEDFHRDAHDGSRVACWECVQQEVRKERRCEYCFEPIDVEATAETGCLACLKLEGGAQ